MAYVRVNGRHFGANDAILHFSIELCVCDECIRVTRHVHFEEARFFGDGISHFSERVDVEDGHVVRVVDGGFHDHVFGCFSPHDPYQALPLSFTNLKWLLT